MMFLGLAPIGEIEITLRILLALILGGILGLERELQGRPAGLRTHALVSGGAALVMLVSMYGFPEGVGDPGRIAAQVVSGIGFLGAGAILRDGTDIRGITTAATLWIVGMIGLAAGNGYYFAAVLTTVLCLIILIFLTKFEKMMGRKGYKLTLICESTQQVLRTVIEICERQETLMMNFDARIVEYGKIKAIKFSADFVRGTKRDKISLVINEINEILYPYVIFVS